MDTFFLLLRKVVVALVFVVFGFTATYIPHYYNSVTEVQAAAAATGVATEFTQWLNQLQLLAVNAATTVSSVMSGNLWIKESVLDSIAWALAKQIVSNMVQSTVDWINSGFRGRPSFLQDMRSFLLESADEAFGEYLASLDEDFSFICEPFRLDVRYALAIEYDFIRTETRPACTLTGIIDNFENFLTGDEGALREGGWDSWISMTSRPVELPVGSILEARDEYRARILNAQGQEVKVLGFGDGFLSAKLCDTVTGPNGDEQDCYITKPGKMLQEALSFNLDSGRQSLIQADEFNEIITALLGQLANQAIRGASGLLGLSGGSRTPYSRGSFADDVRAGVSTAPGVPIDVGPIVTTPIDSGTAVTVSYFANTLSNQTAFVTQIDSYISRFEAFMSDPRNSPSAVAAAQASIADAQRLRESVLSNTISAEEIITRYTALDAEYAGADFDRQNAIRAEQSTIIIEFNSLGFYSPELVSSTISRWDTILALGDATARDIPPELQDYEPCIEDRWSLECLDGPDAR